jgi:hypothetical protein
MSSDEAGASTGMGPGEVTPRRESVGMVEPALAERRSGAAVEAGGPMRMMTAGIRSLKRNGPADQIHDGPFPFAH